MNQLPVILRPEAAIDIRQSKLWYEMQSPGLGTRFFLHFSQAVELIQKFPLLFPKLLEEVRGSRVRKFPYVIYYRILSDRIEILAVMHGSREHFHWQNRI